jgi:hypothetical protein
MKTTGYKLSITKTIFVQISQIDMDVDLVLL